MNMCLLRRMGIFTHATNLLGLKNTKWEIWQTGLFQRRLKKSLLVRMSIPNRRARTVGQSFIAVAGVMRIIIFIMGISIRRMSFPAKSRGNVWNALS